jgi:mRNA-degrading endonuclease RelE of RelBE toxin-antitoxin system
VTYWVEFHAKAAEETRGLPGEAFQALYDALASVARFPWTSSREDRLFDDVTYRWAAFGRGYGIVQFRVDDNRRVVHVHTITWTG